MARTSRGKVSPPVAVASFALLSRIFIILIQVVVANLLPDHHADAFHLDPVIDPSASDKAVQFLIGGFSKWDASYFLHIAQHGYTRAEMFAFFPLYPCLVRILADIIILPLQHVFSLHMSMFSCVLTAAVALNIVVFCCAAVVLYHLGVHVWSCQRLAYKAALLFCINPASVFMTAAYTESLFALLSFAGMLSVEYDKLLLSMLLFALSGAVRSNGLISVGFLLYFVMKKTADLLTYCWEMIQREPRHKLSVIWNVMYNQFQDVLVTVTVLPCCVIILLPFTLFQMYSFMVICTNESDMLSFMRMCMNARGLSAAPIGHVPSWCRHAIPLPYAAIQSQHWNVGFLKYFEFKQIPNFLLALPMVVLCVGAVTDYCQKRWNYVCVLGLLETRRVREEYGRIMHGKPLQGVYSNKSLVYIVHMTVLLVFGVTCMHIQVVTRFIASSCPVVFWYAAHLTSDGSTVSPQCTTGCSHQWQKQRQTKLHQHANKSRQDELFDMSKNEVIVQYMSWYKQSYITQLVLGYFAGYCIIGICMHCNFLPWT